MEYIDIKEVYRIHEQIVIISKGKPGVKDFALLHSAIERPKATYGGEDLYPTLFAKATALMQSLCLNHAFFDANKRTAWASTKWFLALNNYHLHAHVKEAADFMVYLDNDKPDFQVIMNWIKAHSKKLQ